MPAQGEAELNRFLGVIVTEIIQPFIYLVFAVAMLVFVWGIFEYIRGGDSEDARAKGAKHILWGFLGFLIMVSVYGIIQLIMNTFFPGQL